MIINETMLNVADNSGAKKVKVFRLLGGSVEVQISVILLFVAVKSAIPHAAVKKRWNRKRYYC